MSGIMGPPPVPQPPSPISPSTPPPITMLPRRHPRRDSHTHPNPSPAVSGRSTPAPGYGGVSASTSGSTTNSSQPVVTPHSPPPIVHPTPGHAASLKRTGLNTATSSSASLNGLAGLGMTSSSAAAGIVPVGTPQTGASKMAAAAKRGQAGIDGLTRAADGEVVEEEDHPLSEKSLKARGYRTVHTLNRLFHLPTRWNLIRPLGQGAYGLVISVQDSLSGEPVAVKCITKVFDKVILARRALREITLLRHFGGHENLTGLIDLDNVWDGYNEIYLYMEPMEADLHQIVRSGQPLSNSHIQYFTYQLLRGMKYVHSANVIHRDLKPGNLLVNADCELKICDFGLARGFKPVTGENGQNDEMKLTEYVATRWYRAPEVMLSNRRYTTAIDIWSIGCILAELLGAKPIFKGKDYVDQLNLILGVLGTPDDETLTKVSSEKAAAYIRTLPHSEPVPFQLILPDAEPQALDLLSFLLVFDPSKRIDVPTALTHAYVGTYHDPTDEPSCPEIFSKWEEVESLQTIPELKEAITREINELREEVRTILPDSDEEEYLDELDESTVLGESSTASPIPIQSAGSFTSPHAAHDPGISPLTSTVPLPRMQARQAVSPLSAKVRDRSKSRDGRGERDSTPPTPASTYTPLSEESLSAAPMTGRSSRRSSGYSMIHGQRRPASFLFGSGMTPMNNAMSLPNAGPGAAADGWTRSRSRAPSSTGEFASLGPLIRQLSTVGLSELAKEGTAESGLSEENVPPMRVSPSDAPASEAPKSFSAPQTTLEGVKSI